MARVASRTVRCRPSAFITVRARGVFDSQMGMQLRLELRLEPQINRETPLPRTLERGVFPCHGGGAGI